MRHIIPVFLMVAIVALVVGLFFPATRRVRESASRTQTNNNLKQCALAMHNFHDTHGRFPAGFGPAPGKDVPAPLANKRLSVWFHILPYLEADGVYKGGVPHAIVPALGAPSDPSSPDMKGRVSFAANVRIFGTETLLANNQPVNSPGEAVIVPAGELISNLTMKKITDADGTSNTLMIATRYSTCNDRPTWYATDAHGASDFGAPEPRGVGGFMGSGSASTPAARDAVDTAIFQITPRLEGCIWTPGLFGHSYGSGGMSTALADGSAKNISPAMSPQTFARALCPMDGNPLGTDWAED